MEENPNSLEQVVSSYMDTYFNSKDNSQYLTSDNQMLLGQVEMHIASLPTTSPLKKIIDTKIDNYYATTKELGKTNSMNNADELRQQANPTRMLIKTEAPKSSRSAFINVAVLLYGIINIGFIIAIAFLK